MNQLSFLALFKFSFMVFASALKIFAVGYGLLRRSGSALPFRELLRSS